jgi:aspartate kinase
MQSIIVHKYGGTSVQDSTRIKNTAKRILSAKNSGKDMVVVVSAMGKTTNELVNLAQEITHSPPKRELDVLLSTGEQISIALLSMALNALGAKTISLTGAQCGIRTTSIHSNARIADIDNARILKELANDSIVIVAGFQGISENGDITTLGRGGSDTTAVALAAALNAEKCEIYTDVDGVFSTDPRIIPSAVKLDKITYDEMLEMAKLGAGVLHPRSVELAKKYAVPLEVKSSLKHLDGTKIIEGDTMEEIQIRGITADDSIARISITRVPDKPGIASQLFKTLSENHITIDMILQNLNHENVNDISFTTPISELDNAISIVRAFSEEIGAESVLLKEDVSKISLIGTGIMGHGEVAATFFETLSHLKINIEMISTSETRISCIIDSMHSKLAAESLHRIFFETPAV